jgi:hypothetical protein
MPIREVCLFINIYAYLESEKDVYPERWVRKSNTRGQCDTIRRTCFFIHRPTGISHPALSIWAVKNVDHGWGPVEPQMCSRLRPRFWISIWNSWRISVFNYIHVTICRQLGILYVGPQTWSSWNSWRVTMCWEYYMSGLKRDYLEIIDENKCSLHNIVFGISDVGPQTWSSWNSWRQCM